MTQPPTTGKLKVALLTREYPPEVYGGAGVHVTYLARELAPLVDLTVHCQGADRPDAVAHRPWDLLADANQALRVVSTDLSMAAAVGSAQLVHSHTWYANLAGHLAAMLYDIPHVMTMHSLEVLRPWKAEQLGGGYTVSSWCERVAATSAAAVVAVSEGMRADILTAYPEIPAERVRVIRNGIDTDEYRPDPQTGVLARYGIDPERPYVIFVGRITRQKGVPILLRAASGLIPDAQLVLLAGAADTPEQLAEVTELVDGLRTGRNGIARSGIFWIPEMLPKPEVIQLLTHATVFACPSIYEPLGIVNLEAMACGTAVVGSRTGGIPEVVAEGETGLLVPVGEPEPLTEALNALLRDPDRADAMGQAGRKRAISEFGWPAIAAQTADLYAELTHSGLKGLPRSDLPAGQRRQVLELSDRPLGYRGVVTNEHGAGTAGSLLSVNVGLPKDVAWHGKTVHTAVWKRPVDGPSQVRRLNIDGDGQGDLAGHGGEHRAVFVYQIESYRYWQGQLGRDDFEYGQFGENFTVSGLADDQVCIGDRYQIGEALFEVTQPRVTCYRVGIRMNEPRMPSLLVSHRRPGFYFRVLREGAVRAGDEIVRVAAGPEAMTVTEVDGLLYLPGHSRERILSALRIPALPDGWKASFRAVADQAETPGGAGGNAGLTAVSPPPAWPGFRSLAVTAVNRESDSVVSVYLADPGGTALPPPRPGQFLTLRLNTVPGGRPLLRSYSLSGPPDAGSYRISVKREPHGAGSQFVSARVHPGDLLEAAAPRGTFVLQPGGTPVLLISAGVGATPVLAMLHTLAASGSARDVWWLHGARSRAEEPFAAEARSLLAGLTHGHRHVCYSRPGPEDVRGRDYQTAGRLSASVLAGLGLPGDADAYICGPAAFMTEISAALVDLGVDGARVHTEIFGAAPSSTPGIAAASALPPHLPAGPPGDGPEVAFARSGLTVRWGAGYGSLLELAEACDVPVRWSCRTGVCHTCETALMSGTVSYSPDPVEEPAEGSTLICCSQPSADLVLDL